MPSLTFTNWEEDYKEELNSGKKLIKISDTTVINKANMKGGGESIFSPLYGGLSLNDIDSPSQEYSCECGDLNGRFYEDEICTNCGTSVKMQYGVNINKKGWIDIAPYYIINPAIYEFIAKVIGRTNLQKILSYDVSVNADGKILNLISDKPVKKSIPYQNIGMFEFRKKFVEILRCYAKIKGDLASLNLILANKNRIFSTKIAVLTSFLRPAFVSSKMKKFTFDDINSVYNTIVSLAGQINKSINKQQYKNLSRVAEIQQKLQEFYSNIISNKLSGKKGLIRSQLMGTRLSFSSRMVIVSAVGIESKIDGVELSYKGFLGLYKLEIMNCMTRGYGKPEFKAWTIWEIQNYLEKANYSNELNDSIYYIMNLLIEKKKGGLWVIINRNPTLDFGSIQVMKVISVSRNTKDYTMSLPLTSLKSLNADFDGDCLNVYSLKEKSIIDAFKYAYNPKSLVLDTTAGKDTFNNLMGMQKDMSTNLFDMLKPANTGENNFEQFQTEMKDKQKNSSE